MKKYMATLMMGAVLVLGPAAANATDTAVQTAQTTEVQAETASSSQTVFVKVNGLVCDFCARALENVFGKRDEVEDIKVDLDTKLISITYKNGQSLAEDDVRKLVTDSGYDVAGIYDSKESALGAVDAEEGAHKMKKKHKMKAHDGTKTHDGLHGESHE